MLFRRTTLAAALAAAVMFAAACDTEVRSVVDVEGDTPTFEVSVALTGEVADVFTDDPELVADLESVFADYTRNTPTRTQSGDTVTWSVEVSEEELIEAAPVTGVGSVSISGDAPDRVVELELVDPVQLRTALVETPDPDAVPVLLDNTSVTVEVRAPRVEAFDVQGDPALYTVEESENRVSVSRSMTDAAAVRVSVTTAGAATTVWPFVLAGVALLAAAALVVTKRRRS